MSDIWGYIQSGTRQNQLMEELRAIAESEKEKAVTTITVTFDSASPQWAGSPETNTMLLVMVHSQLAHQLQVRGHIFANEVLDVLGIRRLPEGQKLGWIADKDLFSIVFDEKGGGTSYEIHLDELREIWEEI